MIYNQHPDYCIFCGLWLELAPKNLAHSNVCGFHSLTAGDLEKCECCDNWTWWNDIGSCNLCSYPICSICNNTIHPEKYDCYLHE